MVSNELSGLNPNNPLERHAGESRHPAIEIDREADKTKVLSYLRRDLLINWIPAFAGMTLFCPNGQSGLNSTKLNGAITVARQINWRDTAFRATKSECHA
jgi:hypothetical protein